MQDLCREMLTLLEKIVDLRPCTCKPTSGCFDAQVEVKVKEYRERFNLNNLSEPYYNTDTTRLDT